MTISLFSTANITAISRIPTDADASDQPSSVATNKLVDTENDFSNVSIGDYVVLWENPKVFTTVTALDSATQLSLADDIITSTDQYYLVVTAADAFTITVDEDESTYDLQVLVSPGDLVDASGQDIDQTLSGCRVVSVDSPTQVTVDLPMGGYDDLLFGFQKSPSTYDADGIDVFYYDADNAELVLTNTDGDNNNYASLYAYGLEDTSVTGAQMLAAVKDAIGEAVGGGWRTNAPIDQTYIGAQKFDV